MLRLKLPFAFQASVVGKICHEGRRIIDEALRLNLNSGTEVAPRYEDLTIKTVAADRLH